MAVSTQEPESLFAIPWTILADEFREAYPKLEESYRPDQTIGLVSGGAALAGGTLLVLTAPSKSAPAASGSISIQVSRDAGATWLSARGTW